MKTWIDKIDKNERDVLNQMLGVLRLPDLHEHESKIGALIAISLQIQVMKGRVMSAKQLLWEIK